MRRAVLDANGDLVVFGSDHDGDPYYGIHEAPGQEYAPNEALIIQAPVYVAALLDEVARLTAEVERLRGELAEAQATLANERGEGEPPVPGFLFTGNAGERSAWCSVDGPVGAYVTREIGNMGRVRWQWAVIEDRYGSDESPRFRDLARGYEPTARAAIRAATKAWRGES
jgi:hypothetical protein